MDKRPEIRSVNELSDFEKLFKEFFIPLSFYSMKFVQDLDTAKEIVHKVFINVWEKRQEIHSNTPIKSYLYTAVKNRSLNYLRDRTKFVKEDISELEEDTRIVEVESRELEQEELEQRILKEINNLPERCGEIFKLSRFEDKKYREISEILGISVKTVEIQMTKALKILRKNLYDILHIIILWITYIYFNFL